MYSRLHGKDLQYLFKIKTKRKHCEQLCIESFVTSRVIHSDLHQFHILEIEFHQISVIGLSRDSINMNEKSACTIKAAAKKKKKPLF